MPWHVSDCEEHDCYKSLVDFAWSMHAILQLVLAAYTKKQNTKTLIAPEVTNDPKQSCHRYCSSDTAGRM